MKLETQVVSLNLAKRLKELGVKQESLFYWGDRYESEKWKIWEDFRALDPRRQSDPSYEFYSAFTVAELGEMLPIGVQGGLLTIAKRTVDDGYGWSVAYEGASSPIIEGYRDTEADSRAKMLIYLLENNLP